MAENIYEIILNENPRLATVLNSNEDISSFLMSAYAHILLIAQQCRGNARDLRVSTSIVMDRLLKIDIQMPKEDDGRSDVGDRLPRQRNLNLVKLLQVNRSIKDLALNAVYTLEKWLVETPWIKEKDCKFEQIKTFNPMLWRDSHTITVELVLNVQFEEFVQSEVLKTDSELVVNEQGEIEGTKNITKGSDLIQ